jgi:dTMP kinase
MRGKFITIEGPDGAGKTTQVRKIAKYLEERGENVIVTREPGGTHLGESLRNIVLSPEGESPEAEAEALIYAASRAQLVKKIILPALYSGKIVICDRFIDSNLAYQGWARGLGIDEILRINSWFLRDCWPDLTIILNIDPGVSLNRLKGKKDRLEQESIRFHKKVRDGFIILSEMFPDRVKVIDASIGLEQVFECVLCEMLNSHIINV